ncbi:TPA: hypothetical protein PC598_002587 [Morganella morganii]|nr:hypothetical protein [Morganella morganii]
MAIKRFYFSQLADLRIEGVGIHASYGITLIVNEEDNNSGKRIRVSALGKSNAAKAAGSGKLLFWCVITNNLNHNKYILEMKKGESWAMGVDDIPIGSVDFDFIKSAITPELTVEFGYVYDAGYAGNVVPFPRSSTKTIKLNKFKW